MESQMHESMIPSSTSLQNGTSHTFSWQKVILFSIIEVGIIVGSIMGGIAYEKHLVQRLSQDVSADVLNSSQLRITPKEDAVLLPPVINVTVLPRPTISPISVCGTLAASSFPTQKADEKLVCQVIELRTRDLLQATYNVHHLLREIQKEQIQLNGPFNKVNNFNNDLIELWLDIAGYGLGTDPYVSIQIQVGASGFKEAESSPSYGFSGYQGIGIPRLYNRFIENSILSAQTIQQRETNFSLLVQPYSNPAQYPHRDFFDRAYNSYRNGKLLDTVQFQQDLRGIDAWLTGLENVLEQIPTFLKS